MTPETGNDAALLAVCKVRGFQGGTKTVLQALAYLSDVNLECSAPPEMLAEHGDVKPRSLPECIRKLIEAGAIEETKKGGGRGNWPHYRVRLDTLGVLESYTIYVPLESQTYVNCVPLANKPTEITYVSPENPRNLRTFSEDNFGRTIETGARALTEGEFLFHRNSPGLTERVNTAVTPSSSVGQSEELTSLKDLQIPHELQPAADAICEVTGADPRSLSERQFRGLVSSLAVIEESEPALSAAEKAEQVRRRFTAPNFAMQSPPYTSQVGQWWTKMGAKLRHSDALKANPAAVQYGGRGQPKNESEAQLLADLAQYRTESNGSMQR